MSETIKLDLSLQSREYEIEGKKYSLVEASAEAAKAYKNAMTGGMVFSKGGETIQITGLGDIEITLVSFCLYLVEGDKKTLVSIENLKRWPNRIIRQMFDWVKEVSELSEEENPDSSEKN